MWRCRECETFNEDAALSCVLCAAPRAESAPEDTDALWAGRDATDMPRPDEVPHRKGDASPAETTDYGEVARKAPGRGGKIWIVVFSMAAVLLIAALIKSGTSKYAYNSGLPQDEAVVTSAFAPTAEPDYVIGWESPVLEAGLREALRKPEGASITYRDVKDIEELYIVGDHVSTEHVDVDTRTRRWTTDWETWTPYTSQETTLEDLRHFASLHELILVDCPVVDLSALRTCSSLDVLSLQGYPYVDLSFLSSVSQLESLCLSGCAEIDFPGVPSNGTLVDLTIWGGGPVRAEDIARLTALQTLRLSDTRIDEAAPLMQLRALKALELTGQSDISFAYGMPTLSELTLRQSDVSDLTPLKSLPDLETLHLMDCDGLSSLAPLTEMRSLKNLWFDSSRIADLASVAELSRLESLSLSGTAVIDISFLAGLTQLQTLWLDETRVSDLSPLAGLTRLESLYLNGTNVRDLSPLQGLPLHTLGVGEKLEDSARELFPNAELQIW